MVQSVGSLLILTGGAIADRASLFSKWVAIGLVLKASMAPLHFWGAVVITKRKKLIVYVLLTWQKIAPLFLLMISTTKFLLSGIIVMNIIVASSCRLRSKHLIILLFFSGLMHICWLLSAPLNVSVMYMAIYFIITTPLFFDTDSVNHPPLMINLAGLPPITGFFIKLSVLQQTRLRFTTILLLFRVTLIYAYIRVFIINVNSKGKPHFILFVCCLGPIF